MPPEHCPDSWGRREEWLANIRRVRIGDLRPTRPEGDAAAAAAAAEQGGAGTTPLVMKAAGVLSAECGSGGCSAHRGLIDS